MQVLVFKTNISRAKDKSKVLAALGARPQVSQATVDMDDCDRVLRVVAALHPDVVMSSVKKLGFAIEELNY